MKPIIRDTYTDSLRSKFLQNDGFGFLGTKSRRIKNEREVHIGV